MDYAKTDVAVVPTGALVSIIGQSSFNGSRGTVTGQIQNGSFKGGYNVTVTQCGRLFENVPFQAKEIYQLREERKEAR